MIVDREEGCRAGVAPTGLAQGVRLLGVSVYDGVSGLVQRPMTGAKSNGMKGCIGGASLVSVDSSSPAVGVLGAVGEL